MERIIESERGRNSMSKMIFVNLAVADVAASTAFFQAMGFEREPNFSNEQASMMKLSDTISIMILSRPFFSGFTAKTIVDSHASVEVMIALSADSREDVDATIAKAAAAGGKADPNPTQDHGFMYGRSYEDLDGHIFEVMWMDVETAVAAMSGQHEAA
jgi:predicted lactoylglutathione lyase